MQGMSQIKKIYIYNIFAVTVTAWCEHYRQPQAEKTAFWCLAVGIETDTFA